MSFEEASEEFYAVSIRKDIPQQKVGISFDSGDGSSTIAKVNGLALIAGLNVGDRVISVNGVSSTDTEHLANLIRISSGDIRINVKTTALQWCNIYSEVGRDIVILSEFLVYELADLFYFIKDKIEREDTVITDVKPSLTPLELKTLMMYEITDVKPSFTPLELKTLIEDNIDGLSQLFKKFRDPFPIYKRLDALIEISGISSQSFTIEHYDKFQKDELVYLVTKDNVQKRIILTFRGTTSSSLFGIILPNWMAKAHVCNKERAEVKGYLKGKLKDGDNVYIHSDFYNLLFEKIPDKNDGEETTKYDQILSIIKPLLHQYPDFNLYVTGHSLGGALATICSFYLACEPDIATPVTCVSYGSPRVGDSNFVNAVQFLERRKMLRIIRVVCDNDTNTAVPSIDYAHVGFELRLFHDENRIPLISYPNLSRGFWKWVSWQNSMVIDFNFGYEHGDYEKRLENQGVQNFLSTYLLDELYKDHDLVGYCIRSNDRRDR